MTAVYEVHVSWVPDVPEQFLALMSCVAQGDVKPPLTPDELRGSSLRFLRRKVTGTEALRGFSAVTVGKTHMTEDVSLLKVTASRYGQSRSARPSAGSCSGGRAGGKSAGRPCPDTSPPPGSSPDPPKPAFAGLAWQFTT
ncbi:hypothetical protein CB1_000345034 [Camelus ferus]|nr:hypothetical protein CB1_000345034 [Camelus ferus]